MLPGDLLLALPETLLIQMMRVGLVLWLACLGASFWRVLLYLVGLPVLITLAFMLFGPREAPHTHLEAVLPILHDPSPLIASALLLAFGMPAIVWGFYRSRDRARSVLAGVALFFVAVSAPTWFPSNLSFVGGPPRLTAAWHSTRRLRSPGWPREQFARSTIGAAPGRPNDGLVSIAGPGTRWCPVLTVAMPYTVSASLRFDDGVSVYGRRSYPQTVQVPPGTDIHPCWIWQRCGSGSDAIRRALGDLAGAVAGTRGRPRTRAWPQRPLQRIVPLSPSF